MNLFESFKIGKNTIKNRLLATPISDNQAERSGRVSQQLFDNLLRVSKQGAGTIVIDSAYVSQQGKGLPLQLGISEERHVPGIRNLVKLLKEDGVFVGLRLSHAGAKTNHKLCGEVPIGPSSINYGKDFDSSRKFDEYDLLEVCTFFGHAAERAEEAGLDFIEINAGQEWLLDQCLNPAINRRDDKYGGTIQNRLLFLDEVLKSVKSRIPSRLLVSVFFNNPLDRTNDESNLDDLKAILDLLKQRNVDLIHPYLQYANQKLYNRDEYVLEYIGNNTTIPIIIGGNIKTTMMLGELAKINRSSFYSLDKALLMRQNWYQFVHKKISNF